MDKDSTNKPVPISRSRCAVVDVLKGARRAQFLKPARSPAPHGRQVWNAAALDGCK
jgi:hypothetical protein